MSQFEHAYRVPAWLSGKVLGGSVANVNHNPGVLGLSCTGFSGSVHGQNTSEPQPTLLLVEPRKDRNNASYRRDMTELLLKVA